MKIIEVWADFYFLAEPQKVGVLTASPSRGKEVFSFENIRVVLNKAESQQEDSQYLKDKVKSQEEDILYLKNEV